MVETKKQIVFDHRHMKRFVYAVCKTIQPTNLHIYMILYVYMVNNRLIYILYFIIFSLQMLMQVFWQQIEKQQLFLFCCVVSVVRTLTYLNKNQHDPPLHLVTNQTAVQIVACICCYLVTNIQPNLQCVSFISNSTACQYNSLIPEASLNSLQNRHHYCMMYNIITHEAVSASIWRMWSYRS